VQSEVGNVPALVAYQDAGSLASMGFRGVDLRFATGSYERLRITSSGNVGIGTTNPTEILHSYKSTGAQALFSGYSEDGASTAAGKVLIGGTAAYQGSLQYSATGTTSLYLDNTYDHADARIQFRMRTAGTNVNALTILGSGNVGIGTASPSNLLSVKGVITSGNQTSVGISGTPADGNTAEVGPGYLVLARDDTANAAQIRFGKNGSLHSYLETRTNGLGFITNVGDFAFEGGNVGIGTDSPNVTLTLSDGTDEFDLGVTGKTLTIKTVTTNGYDDQTILIDAGNGALSSTRGAYVRLHGNETSSRGGQAIYQIGNVSGAAHIFRKAGGSDAVIINSSGKVGIGTTSPSTILHIEVDVNQSVADTNDAIDVLTLSATEKSSANMVVGNGPAIKFKIPGNINSAYDGARIAAHKASASDTNNDTYLTFSVNNTGDQTETLTERMRIDSSGHITPGEDNEQDFGSTSKRWASIYTGDLL